MNNTANERINISSNNKNNKIIISKFIEYIIKEYSISKEELFKVDNNRYSNLEEYTKNALRSIKGYDYKYLEISRERDKVRQDLEDLERAYVTSDCMTPREEGKNNGGKKEDSVMLRHIKLHQLREELAALVIESQNLTASIDKQKDLLRAVINLTQNEAYRQILFMTFCERKPNGKVADTLGYSVKTVDQYKKRGIDEIVKVIIKCEVR